MKALVTGGAGFIGSHLCEALLAAGHEVLCLDDLSTGNLANLAAIAKHPRFRFIPGGVESSKLDKAFRARPDWVFHYGATVGVARVVDKADRVIRDGEQVPRVLDLARKADVQRFLFASSSEVYGNGPPVPFRESGPLNPEIPYAAVKLFAEKAMETSARMYGLRTTAFRFFNVYGPRQDGSAYGHVVGIFVRQARAGQPLTVFGTGKQTRDFTYIADNIKATLLAVQAKAAEGQVVNIGTGRPTTINELAKALVAANGSGTIVHGPARAYEIKERAASVERLRSLIGYVPDTPLEDGLRATLRAGVAA